MKHASSFWLTVLAACLCLNTTMRGQTVSHSDDGEVSISLRDSSADDPSASVVAQPQQPIQQVQDEIIMDEMVGPPIVQNPMMMDPNLGYASTTDIDQVLYRVGNTSLDLYGVPSGHTNFHAFVPLFVESNRALWYVVPRANLTNEGSGGANVGIGRRVYDAAENRVFGAGLWYDFEGAHGRNYHSLGGSFESLGQYFSLRGNFDLIVGPSGGIAGRQTGGNPRYVGSNIVLDQLILVEQAYDEYNIEASIPMPIIGDYGFDVAAGFYYLAGEGQAEDTPGFSLRGQAQITEDFYLNAVFTTDDVFDSNVAINLEYTLPNGSLVPSRLFRRKPVTDMLTETTMRRYRIPVNTTTETATVPLLSTKDGLALNVAHIDPDATSAGTGTIANPFMSIAEFDALADVDQAEYDIIFVRGRADATDTNLNTTLTLFDNQALFGDGTAHTFESNLGILPLPGVTLGANAPMLTNSGALGMDVVRLANSNHVAGFTIDAGLTADGISGTGIDGFQIRSNSFTNVINGINIVSDTSAALAGCFEDQAIITGNNMLGDTTSMDGISLTHINGTLGLTLTDNIVTGFDGFGSYGADVNVTGGVLNANDDANGAIISGNNFSGNGGGLRVNTVGPAVSNLDVQLNTASNNVATVGPNTFGNGIEIISDGAVVNLETFISNTTDGNAETGTILQTINGGTMVIDDGIVDSPAITGHAASGNGIDGMRIEANDGTITIDQIAMNTFGPGNGDDGLEISAAAGGSVTVADPLIGNTFDGNLGSGMEVNTNGGGSIAMQIGILDAAFTPNTFNNNGEDGLAFNLTGGMVTIPTIALIEATGNGRHGMSITNSEGGTFSSGFIVANNFNDNTQSGLFLGGTGAGAGLVRATTDLGNVLFNTFDRTAAGTMGIEFDTTDVLTTGQLIGNTFIGGNANTAQGIGGTISGNAAVVPPGGVNFVMGTNDPADANIFQNNVDAHIGLIMEGNTVNQITIEQHIFDGAIDGSNVAFNGDGVAYVLRDTAQLNDSFIRGSSLTNNEGRGVAVSVTGNNGGMFAQVNNFTVGGSMGNGNTITGNGQTGVYMERTADGEINDALISFNTIANNGLLAVDNVNPDLAESQFAAGIYLLSANAPKVDTIRIEDNLITTNDGDGILLDVRADGQMSVPILRNEITNNGQRFMDDFNNGIHTVEQVTDATDLRGITGPWQANLIQGNAGRGILLDAASGNTDPMTLITTPLLIGDLADDTLGNIIAQNGLDGIEQNGAGNLIISRNLITLNGTTGGFTPQNDMGIAAIDLNTTGFGHTEVLNNDITDNRGDAIEIEADETLGLEFVINDNIIDFNDGRGLDLLSKAATNNFGTFTETIVDFNNNIVNANRMEGVYIVQSADANQDQSGLQPGSNASNAGFMDGGNLFATPRLIFNSDNNMILANGIDAEQTGVNDLITATGFVVYVGSSDGGYSSSNPGGFASDAFTGGIVMSITNTTLSGNFGSDLFFRSFTSIDNASSGSSGTSWDNMGFNPNGYQGDPLSRLDLTYANVAFDGTDVTNIGGFYDNADGTFKSRTFNNMAPADGGPFSSASRQRNVQRQAARYDLPPTNPVFGGASFLYPGIGESTFRIRGDLTEIQSAGFILDDFPPFDPNPLEDPLDANGIYRAGNLGVFGIDRMPYGWGLF